MISEDANVFYLPSLMRIRELGVRALAAENGELVTLEYFNLLADILKKANGALASLERLAIGQREDRDMDALSDLDAIFKKAGCGTFHNCFEEILTKGATSATVREIADSFGAFEKKLRKLHNVPESLPGGEDACTPEYEEIINGSIAAAVKKLDEDDKTRKLRVLAVDDTPFMLKIVQLMLGDQYKVYSLTQSSMVEEALNHIVPELFLLDFKMPDVSGFDLIPIIRGCEEHKNTPIIFMSALGTKENLETAMKLGACDFVTKPFDGNDLLKSKIAAHIVRKPLP